MKELMKTNVYDVGESVLIVGSCLPDMEPEGFAQLCASSGHVFELCLEQTHINMAITKISAMLYTGKIRTLRFATVDRPQADDPCAQRTAVRLPEKPEGIFRQ